MPKMTLETRFKGLAEKHNIEFNVNSFETYFRAIQLYPNKFFYIIRLIKIFEEFNVRFPVQRLKRMVEHQKKSNLTVYYFFLKYGKIEGVERFNSYRNKQAFSNSVDYFVQKHGKKGYELWEKRNKDVAITLENFKRKYGEEEGSKRFATYCEKQSYSNTLEYYQEKFGNELGETRFLEYREKMAYTQTLPWYIEKFGEVEGLEKFLHFKEKFKSGKTYSEISQELFRSLELKNPDKTYYYTLNKEFNMFCNSDTQNVYFYDFVDSKSKKIIEFNGDYWHKNPLKFDGDYSDIWKRDQIKKEFAESKGFQVLIVWESEYRKNKVETIRRCNEFISN